MCDIFCLLSQPVAWPNTSALVLGSQDLLGALIKPCPSHGVYGRGTGEWQGLHGEEWHRCQWGTFSSVSELDVVGNAKLMWKINWQCKVEADRTGRGRKGSTGRCGQSNQSERSQFLCFCEKYVTAFGERCSVGYAAREIFEETDSEKWPSSSITYTHGLFLGGSCCYPKGTTSASDFFFYFFFPSVFLC